MQLPTLARPRRRRAPYALAGTALLSTLAVSSSTLAFDGNSSEYTAEIQIGRSALADILDQTIKAATPCPSASPLGTLDKMRPRALPTFTHVPGKSVNVSVDPMKPVMIDGSGIEVNVPFDLGFKTDAIINDPNAPVDKFSSTATVDARFTMGLTPAGVCLTFASATANSGNALTDALIAAAFSDKVKDLSTCVPIKPSSLKELAGKRKMTGQGVAYHHDRLAVRMEYGPRSDSEEMWEDFFAGDFAPLTDDMSVFVDRKLLFEQGEQQVRDGVAKVDGAYIDEGPDSSWGAGENSASLDIDAVIRTPGVICENRLKLAADTDFTYAWTLDGGNLVMTTTSTLDWDAKGIARWLACGVLFDAVANSVAPGSEWLIRVLKGAVELPRILDASANQKAGRCEKSGDTVTCLQPLSPVSFNLSPDWSSLKASFSPTGIKGIAEGLVLRHKYSLAGRLGSERLDMQGEILFGTHGACREQFIGFAGDITFTGAGRTCKAPELREDSGNLLELDFPYGSTLPIEGQVRITQLETYRANPYPVLVKVVSTAGSKTFKVPTSTEAPSGAQLDTTIGIMRTLARLRCYPLLRLDAITWFPRRGVVDPSPILLLPYDTIRVLVGNRLTNGFWVRPGITRDWLPRVVRDRVIFRQLLNEAAGRTLTDAVVEPLWISSNLLREQANISSMINDLF